MKLWIDDIRPAPTGYRWAKSVDEALAIILDYDVMYRASGKKNYYLIEIIDLDHDAGEYTKQGGDYIKLLDWIEKMQNSFLQLPIPAFHIHSMNPVGVENMRRIIQKNNWKEI